MARVIKPKEEEATFTPETEEVKEEVVVEENVEEKKDSEDDIVVDSASGVTLTANDKKYKVRLRSNHSCHIGGETYHFKKGETYNVSGDVKRILASADLLSNL